MNMKVSLWAQRLIVVMGLILVSLELVAPPVSVAHADFPVGVGFSGWAVLDSENPPYFRRSRMSIR